MGRVNHSVSIVAKVLPADVRGQIELDLTEGCKSQACLLDEYSAKHPAEFGQFSERAFYRWCAGILNDWDQQRRELARERLRATYALKNSAVAQASLQDCEEAAQRKFHELLAAIATDQATDVETLKSVVSVVDSIGVLGKLSINRDKLAVLQNEDRRRQEQHDAKMAEVKTTIDDAASKSVDGRLDKGQVYDLIDKAMRGETI